MPRFEVTLGREVRDLEITQVVVEAADRDAAESAALGLVEPDDPPEDWCGWGDWVGLKRLDCEQPRVESIREVPASARLTPREREGSSDE